MDATQLIDTFPIDARQTERQTPLSSLRAISMLDLFPLNWPSLKKGKLFFFFLFVCFFNAACIAQNLSSRRRDRCCLLINLRANKRDSDSILRERAETSILALRCSSSSSSSKSLLVLPYSTSSSVFCFLIPNETARKFDGDCIPKKKGILIESWLGGARRLTFPPILILLQRADCLASVGGLYIYTASRKNWRRKRKRELLEKVQGTLTAHEDGDGRNEWRQDPTVGSSARIADVMIGST